MRIAFPFQCLQRAAAAMSMSAILATSALAQMAPSFEHDRIAAKISNSGSARVIVGLDLTTQREGRLGRAAVAMQRANIRAAQNDAVTRLLGGTRGRVHALFNTLPHFAAEVDQAALARIRNSPLVKSLQEDLPVAPSLLQSVPLINAPTAWNAGRTGSGWAVAVLDTGIDKTHPFLAGKIVSEACYSSNTSQSSSVCPGGVTSSIDAGSGVNCNTTINGCTHGTHVAGIVAGAGAPDGSNGVARAANIIAVQVFSYFPAQGAVMSWTSDQILGLERVLALRDTYNIAAVNMSLGGGQYTSNCDATQQAIKGAIDNLRSVGIATVIASGNSSYRDSISAPACISTAVSVGATCDAGPDGGACATGVGGVASYSNIAPFVSVLAPGSYITSSVPGGGYAAFNGTSMAAPHVAGAWALMKHSQPSLSVDDALSLLRSNAVVTNDTRSGGTAIGLRRIDLGFLVGAAHTLAVSKDGSGNGTVLSAPSGINCGSDCTEPLIEGTTVTLSAQPSAGSVFAGWSGACTGTGTCVVTMSAAQNVTATFTAVPYTLSVTKAGLGSGSVSSNPAGINCGTTCSASFNGGSSITLTATPATGSSFTGWSGACTGTASCTVLMSAARSVTANFALQSFPVTLTKAGTGTGTVASTPSGISCGTTCATTRTYGSTMTLTATAATGSVFSGWSGACSGTGTCTLAVTEARSVTATFTRVTQSLTIKRAGTGAGTISSNPLGIACGTACVSQMSVDSVVSLTATPASGSTFAGWSGACTGTSSTCNISMTAAQTVTATFTRIMYTLSVTRDGSGTGSVASSPSGINCGSTCSKDFPSGTVVTLTPKASLDSAFAGWSGICSGTGTCTVPMDSWTSVKATFNLSKYTLSASKNGTGTGSVAAAGTTLNCGTACSALLPIGSSVALTATPAAESAFTGWSGACSGTGACSLTMSTPLTAIATFARTHYTLTVSKSGTGAGQVVSTPSGIDCGTVCKASMPINSTVTLTPVAANGSTFTGWSGACTGTGACTVSMSAARNVSASFTRITYTLTVAKSGTGTGSVTSVPSGISCGSTCSRAFNSGVSVTLSASAGSGNTFAGWTGACSGTGACNLSMSEAKAVGAIFNRL